MGGDRRQSEAEARICAAFDGHDAFTLLAGLSLASAYGLPSRNDHRSPKLPSFVVEYAHGYAAQRATRQPTAPSDQLQSLERLADDFELVAGRLTRPLGLSDKPSDVLTADERNAQASLRIWQLFSHDPGPADAELARLMSSLAPFSDELVETLGFDVVQACAIVNAFDLLTTVAFRHVFGVESFDTPEILAEVSEQIRTGKALQELPFELGEHLCFNSEMIAVFAKGLGTEIPPAALASFLDRFSMGFGDVAAGSDPARVLWDVRDRPLLRDASGFYLWTVPYNLAFAIRPVCERALREMGGQTRSAYDKSKAAILEEEALETLHNELTVDGSWRTLEYESPTHAGQYVEGDGLVVVDSVALSVESKSVELSPSARQGSAPALAKKLQETIVKGAAQGQRTRDALLGGKDLTGIPLWEEARETIATVQLSRLLPIVVIQEPLGAVSSALWRLVELPAADAPWPWVVNIDDLRWFARELELPARLLHYAVVRERIAAAGRLGAIDEADWFWMYYSQGASVIYEKLELLSRFSTQHVQIVGPDVRRGRKLPGTVLSGASEPLVVDLHRTRIPGWCEIAIALLDLPQDSSSRLASEIDRAVKRNESVVTWIAEPPATDGGSGLLVGIGPPERVRLELPGRADDYAATARADGAAILCLLCIDSRTATPAIGEWRSL